MEKLKHFEILNNIDVSKKIEKKGNLKYLSWSYAWAETKKNFPDAKYDIVKNEKGLPYFHDESTGYIVFTYVIIENIRHDMWLPVLDYKNKVLMNPTMFDINKTLMRCLTKNLAMFGMGLYVYEGEDMPNIYIDETNKTNNTNIDTKKVTEPQLKRLFAISQKKKITDEMIKEMIKKLWNIDSKKDLDQDQYKALVDRIEKKQEEN